MAEGHTQEGIFMRLAQMQSVLFVLGCTIAAQGVVMFLPALVDLDAHSPTWPAFATASAVTTFFGGALAMAMRQTNFNLTTRQIFVLTSLIWFSAAAFGALPFYLWRPAIGLAGAFFESASGITTTGSTVLVGLDSMDTGILLWRALQQWYGGVGIVVLAAALMPVLRIGGMQLFQSESSDRSQKVFAQMRHIALSIAIIYLSLTALCTIAYDASGMETFDALVHAMATVSTGGFSTSDASLGGWDLPALHWFAVFFMLICGMPFPLFIRLAQGKPGALLHDTQVRYYLAIIALVVLALIVIQLPFGTDKGFSEILRHSAFNAVSIITTTGFATQDYQLWGPAAAAIFLVITFIGGCTGSTAGGLKIFRLQILIKTLRQQLDTLVYPHGFFPIIHGGRALNTRRNEILLAVVTFTIAYFALVTVVGTILAATGLDIVTSYTSAASAVGNVGPGLGPIVGPAGNFSTLGDLNKYVLAAAMVMGRLEIMTVLVLLSPHMWRS